MFVLLALATASVPDYTSIMASSEEVYGVYLVARDESAVGTVVISQEPQGVPSSDGNNGQSQERAATAGSADKEQMTTPEIERTEESKDPASSLKGIPLPMRQARSAKPESKPRTPKSSARRTFTSAVSSARSPLPPGEGTSINSNVTEAPVTAVRIGAPEGGRGTPGQGDEDTLSAHALGIQPEYPLFARKHGQEGRVLFRVSFDPEGGITQLALVRSSGFTLLDSSAQKALSKARLPSWAGLTKFIAFTFALQR